MSPTPDLAQGLARALSTTWGETAEIEIRDQASAGARRHNVLFDALRGGERIPLVATIIPNPAIQVMDVEVEAASLRLAESQGMPVPHVHGVWQDTSLVGGPFFVSTRIDGETIPRQVLRLVEAHPGLGATLAGQCGGALARLHAADADKAHEGLIRPREDDCVVEQALTGVAALIGELLQPSPSFTLGLRWLERHAPAPPERLSVLHGDFRNGNLIVGDDGLRAVLDWEVGHLGDPMEDAAWLCMRMWRFRNDELEVGGFGQRAQLREGYEAAGGAWRDEAFHWWKVLGTLRWGLGLAGQAKAHIDGSVPNIIMAASGRRVAELEYDLLMLLQPTDGAGR
ncbi:MAG: phosphotransferase [Deltaproteobacteria bacterium]|nr:phosphotransferase [Deltaproteobacteria bacterium]